MLLYLAAVHIVTARCGVNDPPSKKKPCFKTLWNVLHFLLCKWMRPPRFRTLFIHWEQMFFSVSMQGLLPVRGRHSNPGVKTFLRRPPKETRFHFSHAKTPPYKHQMGSVILTWKDKNSFLTCFSIIADFSGQTSLSPFCRKICIKFYGDYGYKSAPTVDPLPVSFFLRESGLRHFQNFLNIITTLYNCDGNHIDMALSLIYIKTPQVENIHYGECFSTKYWTDADL